VKIDLNEVINIQKKVEEIVKALYILHKQNRRLNLILIAASIAFFAIVYFLILHMMHTNVPAVAGKSFDGQNRYNITVLDKDPDVEQLNKFHEVLENNKQVTLYNASPVNISIDGFSGGDEFTPPNMEDANGTSPVYGLQINKAAQKLNHIQMDSGRFFDAKEFENYNGKGTLPVILGSSFFTLYDVNDEIQLNVHGTKVQAKIIGFLKSEQTLVTPTLSQLSAKHQVIIPTQDYTGTLDSSNEYVRQSILASSNAILVTSASKIGIRDVMLNVSKESNYWNFAIGGAGGMTVNLYSIMIKANPILVGLLLLIGIVGMAVLLLKTQEGRNKNNRKLFGILINSGMDGRSIKLFTKMEMGLILAIGILVPLVPFLIVSQMAIKLAIIYLVVSIIIAACIVFIVDKRTKVEMEREHV